MITSPSQLVQTPSSVLPPIIRIFHDESTFHANADQSYHWSDGSNNALKQKSLGQAVMVSDFIDEVNGYLEFEGEEARLYLEHHSERYFTNDLFVDQVMKALARRSILVLLVCGSSTMLPPTSRNLRIVSVQTE